MKGLITKDIRLLLRQKNMLLLMVLLVFFFSHNGLEITLGYVILMSSMLGMNTLAYDTMDNSMAYLMTLPVGRKTYVLEKYAIALLPGVLVTALAIAIRFAAALISQQPPATAEIIVGSIGIFLMVSLLTAIFLPLDLKFGMEKARIVALAGMAAFAVIFYTLVQSVDKLQGSLMHALEFFVGMNKVVLGVGAIGIWVVLIVISMLCSVHIIEKKEF